MVERFYHKYQPLITHKHHTCVGLGFELMRRLYKLNERYSGISSGLYLVSCEEVIIFLFFYFPSAARCTGIFEFIYDFFFAVLMQTIGDIAGYVGGPPAADSGEKEHVLVCLKIEINGRRGILLLDPGYHVARVITVMADKSYPHTGWFTQSEEPNCKKEYNYSLCAEDSDYVEWHERENRPGALERTQVALIYIARPYLTAIDVTERRNLVYNFRSLLARDTKGHVTSGIYFPIVLDVNNGQNFTLFYQTNTGKVRVKMPFNKFGSTSKVRKTLSSK